MNDMMSGGIIGAVAAAAVLLFIAMTRKPVKCPSCGREQPKVRKPANMQQAMWGGHTCAGCGAEMDGRGRLRTKT